LDDHQVVSAKGIAGLVAVHSDMKFSRRSSKMGGKAIQPVALRTIFPAVTLMGLAGMAGKNERDLDRRFAIRGEFPRQRRENNFIGLDGTHPVCGDARFWRALQKPGARRGYCSKKK